MCVTTADIKKIKAGSFYPFKCANSAKMQSVASMLSQIKRLEMPEGVVDYEYQKFFDENIIIVHAMKEGEEKVLNR